MCKSRFYNEINILLSPLCELYYCWQKVFCHLQRRNKLPFLQLHQMNETANWRLINPPWDQLLLSQSNNRKLNFFSSRARQPWEIVMPKENYNNIRRLEIATRKDSSAKDLSSWMCQTKTKLKGNLLASSEVGHSLVCFLRPPRLCHLLPENEPAIRLLSNKNSIRKQKNLWWNERWIHFSFFFVWCNGYNCVFYCSFLVSLKRLPIALVTKREPFFLMLCRQLHNIILPT